MFGAWEKKSNWRCTSCGRSLNDDEVGTREDMSRWRWNGKSFEHLCRGNPPQCGHFIALPVEDESCSASA